MPIQRYLSVVERLLERIANEERAALERAAAALLEVIKQDGLLHVVGAGHSAIIGEELFYRAGGLAIVNPLINTDITVAHGAERSTALEKLPGYARTLLQHAGIEPRDAVLVVSTSGVNEFPVEAALYAKEVGARTLGLTAVDYSAKLPPRNSYEKRLFEIVDIVLDNKVPPGDAVLELPGLEVLVAPVSTITAAFIVNSIVALTVERALQEGLKPPVWLSAHLDGVDEYNGKFFARYRPRIRIL